MCNIEDILNGLKQLDRHELSLVQQECERLLKTMKPMSIRQVYKRCNKPNCTCRHGPVAEYGHGPYLVATYSDGKQKQKNLGKWFPASHFHKLAEQAMPQWYDFVVTDKQVARMNQDIQWRVYSRTLDNGEFEAYYGISPDDDKLGRSWRLQYNNYRYNLALEDWNHNREIAHNPYRSHGVAKRGAIVWLNEMLEQGYYLSERPADDD